MRYVAFDRVITDSTERGSELARITPADAIATSVPAPMAMPTSAWASAGASLTPSPTIATLRPSACSSATLAALSSRPHAREHPVDAEVVGDRPRHRLGVPGDHHDLDAQPVQGVDRLTRLRSHFVGQLQCARHGPVDQDVQHDRAFAVPRPPLRAARPARPLPTAADRRRGPDGRRPSRSPRPRATTKSPTPQAPSGFAPSPRPTMARASGCSESVSAAAASASTSDLAAATRRGHRRHARLTLRQGAGLVEQHGADRPHALQREPVLDQHAARGPRVRWRWTPQAVSPAPARAGTRSPAR